MQPNVNLLTKAYIVHHPLSKKKDIRVQSETSILMAIMVMLMKMIMMITMSVMFYDENMIVHSMHLL